MTGILNELQFQSFIIEFKLVSRSQTETSRCMNEFEDLWIFFSISFGNLMSEVFVKKNSHPLIKHTTSKQKKLSEK